MLIALTIAKLVQPGDSRPASLSRRNAAHVQVRVAIACILFVLAACQASNPTPEIPATLPQAISGQSVSYSVVTAREPSSGVPADDILAKLGKTRADANVVKGSWANGDITLIAIPSVPTAVVRGAVIEVWDEAAIVSRSETTVAGHAVEILTYRDHALAYVLSTATAVFVVQSQSKLEAEAAIALLPVG